MKVTKYVVRHSVTGYVSSTNSRVGHAKADVTRQRNWDAKYGHRYSNPQGPLPSSDLEIVEEEWELVGSRLIPY